MAKKALYKLLYSSTLTPQLIHAPNFRHKKGTKFVPFLLFQTVF